MTDPEYPSTVDRDDLRELEADGADDVDRDLPVEADEADAYDQARAVPDAGEDDYPI